MNADAELIMVARQAEAAERTILACNSGKQRPSETETEFMGDCARDLSDRLVAMKAVTIAGMVAKARAVRVSMQNSIAWEVGSTVESCGESHELLMWSLLNDLVAFAESASDTKVVRHG